MEKPSCKAATTASRKAPTQRIFEEDKMGQYEKACKVYRFGDLDEFLLDFPDNDYKYAGHGDHVVLFKFVLNDLSIPQIYASASTRTSTSNSFTKTHRFLFRVGSEKAPTVSLRVRMCSRISPHISVGRVSNGVMSWMKCSAYDT